MRYSLFMLATLWASLGLFAVPALAIDQLVLGTKLMATDAGNKNRIVFLSRDEGLTVGTGADAPTVAGMRFQILNPLTGASATFDLPARFWKANRFGTKYTYKDRRAEAGLVRKAVFRNGRLLKVVVNATGISLAAPSQGALAVVLVSGAQRYCAIFAADAVRRDVACRFMAKKSARPVACPPGAVSSPSGAFVG